MNIYEIDQAILDCFDSETGEVLDEEALNGLVIERAQKIENVILWVKNLKSDVADLKNEETALADRRKGKEKKITSLTKWLYTALDGEKFETPKCQVSFRKSSITEVDDGFVKWAIANGRDELLTYKDPTPNKTAIKQSGEEFEFARVIEQKSMSIK